MGFIMIVMLLINRYRDVNWIYRDNECMFCLGSSWIGI